MSDLLREGRARPTVVVPGTVCWVCEVDEDDEISDERALLKESVLEEEIAFVDLLIGLGWRGTPYRLASFADVFL